MKKWVFVSDLIFTFTILFLPMLCWLRFLHFPLWSAILLSALVGAGGVCLVGVFKSKKDEKLLLKHTEEKERRLLLSHLSLLSPEACLRYLFPDETPVVKDGLWVLDKEPLIFPLFLWRKVGKEEVLPFVRLCLTERKQGKILCEELTDEARAFLSAFAIEYEQGTEVYKRLKEEERLPENYLSAPFFAKKKKRLGRLWFAKKNSRRFLIGGGLLLLSSLIVPFPYYYVVCGCVLMLAAALVRILGYR